jgi:hypothetical protein
VNNMAKKVKPQTKRDRQNSKFLEKVPAAYVFYCHDGIVFTDVNELAAGLATMSDETFAYHSNPEKQDFSNWVRDIIGDEQLANNLAWSTSREQAAQYVVARINELTCQ